jgi:signal transduction histidine kinase
MMNSIFKKMLTLALSISLGSLLCSSVIIGFLLEKQIYQRTQETLYAKATELHKEVKHFLNGELDKEELKQKIVVLQQQDHIQVSILTNSREPLFFSGNPEIRNWTQSILIQKSEFKEMTFHKNDELQMFIVALPLLLKGESKGAIFLYTSVKEAEGLVADVNRNIALSVVLLLGPIVAISFFISKKFSRPILAMNKTVANISRGNFDEKVLLNGRDELGTLGDSINSMADRLAVIEQSRRRFIGEISHELRTPMTTIRSTLQGISDEIFDEEEQDELIDISIREISRISQLIDDLTDLSALEEKAVVLHLQDTSLSDLLEGCLLQLSLQAKSRGIFFVKKFSAAILIEVDRDRMKQVLINLLDNAIKYAPADSVVRVEVQEMPNFVELVVENEVKDLPSESLLHLFDRFYKMDESRSQKGNGLGLAISKKIVEIHRGEISVQLDEGKIGFIVKLPKKAVV